MVETKFECGNCRRKFKTRKHLAYTINEPRPGLFYLNEQGFTFVCKLCQKAFGAVFSYRIYDDIEKDKRAKNKFKKMLDKHRKEILPIKKNILKYQKRDNVNKEYWITIE